MAKTDYAERKRANPVPTPQAQRYLDLHAEGKSIREIADLTDRAYFTVWNCIRYWTEPAYRERRLDEFKRQNKRRALEDL
jgi:transposase